MRIFLSKTVEPYFNFLWYKTLLVERTPKSRIQSKPTSYFKLFEPIFGTSIKSKSPCNWIVLITCGNTYHRIGASNICSMSRNILLPLSHIFFICSMSMKKNHFMRKDHKEAETYKEKEKKKKGNYTLPTCSLKNGTLPTYGPIC